MVYAHLSHSFYGTLKNALDHLDTNYFQNKPIAFITHCHEHSSRMPDQLRIVAQGLLAMPIPTQIDTTDVDFELKDTYVLVTPRIEKLLSYIADELVEYSLFMRRY